MTLTIYSIPRRWGDAPVWTGEVDFGGDDDAATRLGKAVVAAHLVGASLDGARLVGASLDGASLVGASLDGARLVGARLDGASLDGARWGAGAAYGHGTPITRAPIIITGLHWSVLIFDSHMKIGCELHSLADWDQFDDRHILQMDGRAALDFWRANKVPLLAMARANGRVWGAPEADEAA